MPRHRKGPPTPELAAEYASGATSTDLARKYDMHHVAVINRLRRAGVPIRPAKRRTIYDDPKVTGAIVSAYQGGAPMCDIALDMNVGQGTVQRAIKAAGVTTRPFGLRKRTVRVPTDAATLGYLAGLFDGEGNLQLRKKHSGRSVGCKMAIYSTTPAVMRWLLKHVGGVVRYDTKRTERKGWLPMGIWEVYRANDVRVLLAAMLPLLIVKKERAEHAMAVFSARWHLETPSTAVHPAQASGPSVP